MNIKKYAYKEARELITSTCQAAAAGEYDTREKFHAMVATHPDIAVQGYNIFGKIFFWNTPSAQLYGYSETAAVNKDLFETILPPEIRQLARAMVAAAPRTGKTPEAVSCDLLRRNGEYVTVFSGHLMFQWENATTPEFYFVAVEIQPHTTETKLS